jgi:predicted RNase H-related nuclease YkuK (DUF458 family)
MKIERDITIEHKGETLHIHLDIHLDEEEIRKIVVPAMLGAVASQMRTRLGFGIRIGPTDRTTVI